MTQHSFYLRIPQCTLESLNTNLYKLTQNQKSQYIFSFVVQILKTFFEKQTVLFVIR